ncbi:MAG: sigma-54-dependent Fis family transcriptional regulator [Calditrichaeota bacterium]|nr:sigma-54-dependent Fis family transcriptional regulator [Calditrichota bacterium]
MSIAPTTISVLITGESGSGKEVFARALHQLSPRKNKSMISVNCGAIPEGLLESELFGHEKGAFTGAISTKKGFFELADGGTIFLDEIGEMPIQTQVRLLRVLETGEFMRVGSGELRTVDARVVAATNRDLGRMVQQKQFRKDLYYRLKAVTIFLPPLRERREDIPLLIEKFTADVLKNENLSFAGYTEEALDMLRRYNWPGNVRELRNFVETAIVLARGQKVNSQMVREQLSHNDEHVEVANALPMPLGITREDAERELVYKALVSIGLEMKEMKSMLMQLFERIDHNYSENNVVYSPVEPETEHIQIKPLDEMEREIIEKALDRYNGNRRKVARALNISERTLYRKIKEYDLVRKDDEYDDED